MFGSGHDGTSTEDRFGKRGVVGNQGEDYFGKALVNSGLDKFTFFRSLGIPAKPNQVKLHGDVDCTISNGLDLILIDIKRWKRGFLWAIPFTHWPMRGWMPLVMAKRKGQAPTWNKLSSNMAAALDRYSAALPHANVSAMVIFVPTVDRDPDSGPEHVELLIWPGAIKSYTVGEAISEIMLRLGAEVVEPLPEITQLLKGLQIHK